MADEKTNQITPEHLAAYGIARLFFTLGRFGPGGPEYSDLDKTLGSVIPFFDRIKQAAETAPERKAVEAAAAAVGECSEMINPYLQGEVN